jgi:hypothetical protein
MKHKTFREVRAEIVKMRSSGATLRKIAKRYPGVSFGTIKRILKGHEPKTPAIRYALGMTVYQPAPACPIHGIVHVGRCPRSTDYKRIADMPPELLKWKLEHRESVSDEA